MTCNTDYLRMHAQVLSKSGSKRYVFLAIQEQPTSELHQIISKTSSNRVWVGFTNPFHNGHRIHAQKATRSWLLSSLRTSHTHIFLKSWLHVKTWFSPKQAYTWPGNIYSFQSKSAPTCRHAAPNKESPACIEAPLSNSEEDMETMRFNLFWLILSTIYRSFSSCKKVCEARAEFWCLLATIFLVSSFNF
jgi:hypothetical protein